MIGELLDAGLLHDDTQTIVGEGLRAYTQEPQLKDGKATWVPGTDVSLNEKIIRPVANPFNHHGRAHVRCIWQSPLCDPRVPRSR